MNKFSIFIFLFILSSTDIQGRSPKTSEVKKIIKSSDLKSLTRLLDDGLDINTKFRRNSTLLHIATEYGKFKIVNYLIEKGANLNEQDKDKNTPLLISTRYRSPSNDSITRLLLSKDANSNIPGLHGSTPLRNTIGIFKVGQNVEIFKLLIEKGADVNYSCKECCSHSIFLYCCSWGTQEMLNILIEKNIDLNFEDCKGYNGLMCAIKTKNKEAIKFLLTTKINVHHKDKKGKTALYYAIKSGDDEIVKMIETAIQP